MMHWAVDAEGDMTRWYDQNSSWYDQLQRIWPAREDMTRWYDSLQLMWHDGVSAERRDAGAGRAGSRLHHPRHVHQHLVNIFLLISDIYPLQHCLLCLTWFLTFWFFDILKSRYLLWYLILFPRWYEPSSLALCSWKIQEVDNSNINTHKYVCVCL